MKKLKSHPQTLSVKKDAEKIQTTLSDNQSLAGLFTRNGEDSLGFGSGFFGRVGFARVVLFSRLAG
jgi:tetrahydromethanopterin S-methyltransferase subunit F